MKDYRLSEIQVKCRERKKNRMSCNDCEFYSLCSWQGFGAINIEPRDMIEVPCKIATPNDIFVDWQVIWRTKEGGCIGTKSFDCEAKADAFLAELKGSY